MILIKEIYIDSNNTKENVEDRVWYNFVTSMEIHTTDAWVLWLNQLYHRDLRLTSTAHCFFLYLPLNFEGPCPVKRAPCAAAQVLMGVTVAAWASEDPRRGTVKNPEQQCPSRSFPNDGKVSAYASLLLSSIKGVWIQDKRGYSFWELREDIFHFCSFVCSDYRTEREAKLERYFIFANVNLSLLAGILPVLCSSTTSPCRLIPNTHTYHHHHYSHNFHNHLCIFFRMEIGKWWGRGDYMPS